MLVVLYSLMVVSMGALLVIVIWAETQRGR
jgi:hypothetical protein